MTIRDLWFAERIPLNLRDAFFNKLLEIKAKTGIEPNWLMSVMLFESGLNPAAYNPTGGATGLIQFMPNTARGLGTTTNELRQMNHVEQLEYVLKYYLPYKFKIKNGADLYVVNFYPYALNKPDDYIIGSEKGMNYAKLVFQQNMGTRVDQNKDGYISKGEWKEFTKQKLQKILNDPAKLNFFFQGA